MTGEPDGVPVTTAGATTVADVTAPRVNLMTSRSILFCADAAGIAVLTGVSQRQSCPLIRMLPSAITAFRPPVSSDGAMAFPTDASIAASGSNMAKIDSQSAVDVNCVKALGRAS